MENVLGILFCLSLFYISITTRLKGYINVLQVQGILLTVIIAIPVFYDFSIYKLIFPAIFLLVKVFLIPNYINKILLDLDIKRIIEPTIKQFTFLLLSIGSIVAIFVVSHFLSQKTSLAVIPFAGGFSAIAVAIYIIMFRKKLIVHVMGFLILENGIFLFGTTVATELPFIIDLGVLLDIFVGVFLMGIVINRISTTMAGFEVTSLKRLKD
jgi:hydrogenase-4 component E